MAAPKIETPADWTSTLGPLTVAAGTIWALGVYALGVLVDAPLLWAAWTLGGAAVFGVLRTNQEWRQGGAARTRERLTARPPR